MNGIRRIPQCRPAAGSAAAGLPYGQRLADDFSAFSPWIGAKYARTFFFENASFVRAGLSAHRWYIDHPAARFRAGFPVPDTPPLRTTQTPFLRTLGEPRRRYRRSSCYDDSSRNTAAQTSARRAAPPSCRYRKRLPSARPRRAAALSVVPAAIPPKHVPRQLVGVLTVKR
jgi:hypothetical protein